MYFRLSQCVRPTLINEYEWMNEIRENSVMDKSSMLIGADFLCLLI